MKELCQKKLSIVVPNYNNEQYLERSVECLINQSYKNIEIIVVNDGSPGNCDEIMSCYLEQDSRVKYVKHEKNMGLFQARVTGAKVATGDYIAFLDADDYASIDFYRTLMFNAVLNDSDIVSGNTVLEFDDGRMIDYTLFHFDFDELHGEECLHEYFRQEGLNFSWHTIWNKIYSMRIWKKAQKHYDKLQKRLVMTEDFSFSTVLFYYAKKMTKVQNDAIFYCQHEITSTSVGDINSKKALNNINDLLTSFDFVENFLKEVNIYDKYEKHFKKWRLLYANMHRDYIKNSKNINLKEKKELGLKMDVFCKDTSVVSDSEFFLSVKNNWNDGLETIKLAIMDDSIKCVSFDVFDTLVWRPFLEPIDLFRFLDKYYRKSVKSGIDFSKMRLFSEKKARAKQREDDSTIEEVTLDDIYSQIANDYFVDSKILCQLKSMEKELELRFCRRRNTFYELYQLACYMSKKVVFTSDMYLPQDTIELILKKNGYTKYDKIYLSSSLKLTKSTGSLYEYLLKDLGFAPEEVMHMGDNYSSDYKVPKSLNLQAFHVAKATDCFMNNKMSYIFSRSLPFWFDTKQSLQFLGIRSMLAVVANTYFDNPFRPIDCDTVFNSDPFLIGYYALGMYSFGVSKWLVDSTKGINDKISFMARDGYLPMKSYDILKKVYKDVPLSDYMYVSRKALIPLIVQDKLDLYKLYDIFNVGKQKPSSVLQYLHNVLDFEEKDVEELCKKNKILFDKPFKTLDNFNIFIKLIIDNYYDEEYLLNNRDKLKRYFSDLLGDKPAVFDVGYSARPEYYISSLCDKKIDTFFLNINHDEALDYSLRGGFNLYTYFPAKPTATGNAYELLLSKQAPSCVSYDCSKNVKPVFEEYKSSYQVEYIVNKIQGSALQFVSDIVSIFEQNIDDLSYQSYYLNMPFLCYLNSSNVKDKQPLSSIKFEDDIRVDGSVSMVDDMQKELDLKNQHSLNELLFLNNVFDTGKLQYNGFVDLSKKGKVRRLLFYILYDRSTLKRRISEITYKFRRKNK